MEVENMIKIRCPNCGVWIYIMEEAEKEVDVKETLRVEIEEIRRDKRKAMYYSPDASSEEAVKRILDYVVVSANVNGIPYSFEIWWAKKEKDGWIGGVKSFSRYMRKEKSKDIWADENDEIFVKQKYGITIEAGRDKSRIKLPERRMKEIAEKLGFELRRGREGLRIYIGEMYRDDVYLERNPRLVEKLIKIWLAFWEPEMI
jgi:uncharacterized Zn finger protein (UPF0148 family)